jgi:hypothetical protein
MIDPIAGTIAKQLTEQLVTSALPDAPVRPEPAGPSRRRRPAASAAAPPAPWPQWPLWLDSTAAKAGHAG